jgi:hypothetical protein
MFCVFRGFNFFSQVDIPGSQSREKQAWKMQKSNGACAPSDLCGAAYDRLVSAV